MVIANVITPVIIFNLRMVVVTDGLWVIMIKVSMSVMVHIELVIVIVATIVVTVGRTGHGQWLLLSSG